MVNEVQSIGVIGSAGVVGSATANTYRDKGYKVFEYDRIPFSISHSLIMTLEADIIFVCLPEQELFDFFKNQVPRRFCQSYFVIRSTCFIGTTANLANTFELENIVHSPEFLTARTSLRDAANPSINVIGKPGRFADMAQWIDHPLTQLYHKVFSLSTTVHPMDSNSSEAMKLLMNGFFAVKLAYWNEAKEFCDKLGANWEDVIDSIVAEGRVDPAHTDIPGHDGKRGFGGMCLPKDLAQLIIQQRIAGLPSFLTIAANNRNTYDGRVNISVIESLRGLG